MIFKFIPEHSSSTFGSGFTITGKSSSIAGFTPILNFSVFFCAASVSALADRVFDVHGACHILCNNAGVAAPNLDLWETEPSDFQWVHGVNVHGVVHGVQAFVPRMIESGEEGVVINTSSGDGGISPLAQQVVYASSKAAVSIITECLAAQLVGRGTRLKASIFYPSGGMLATGIWTTKRNRPAELARKTEVDADQETTF